MTQWLSDEELMAQVRNDACEQLGLLFDRYQSPLFNFYVKLTGNRMLSEDLVQEVFLRILKYRRSYRPGSPFKAWMYRIARNARLDHARKQAPQTEFEPEMAPAVTPHDPAQQRQESALLHRALMQIPEEKREILILSRLQELKYDEIAELLGCEVGTVKVRVHRALQDLKQAFHQLQTTPPPRVIGSGGAAGNPPQGSWQ
ncbi:MAG: RNA polymerase sigma factor [Candidatus Acidiferrales bacterium]